MIKQGKKNKEVDYLHSGTKRMCLNIYLQEGRKITKNESGRGGHWELYIWRVHIYLHFCTSCVCPVWTHQLEEIALPKANKNRLNLNLQF